MMYANVKVELWRNKECAGLDCLLDEQRTLRRESDGRNPAKGRR